MTQNQIAYWNLQEAKRSNIAREQETNRHNTVSEGEVGRHNRETESFNISQLQETQRHNVATENLGNLQLNESIRHNTVSEQQSAIANIIRSRANDINEVYNNALINLKNREYTLANEKEIQRIKESQRDFNEAVRMNDAKLIIDAYDSGNDTVRTILGSKGLIGAGLLGAGAVGTAAAVKNAQPTGSLRSDIFKPASSAGSGSAAAAKSTGSFDLFLVPTPALEYFKRTSYGSGSNNVYYTR